MVFDAQNTQVAQRVVAWITLDVVNLNTLLAAYAADILITHQYLMLNRLGDLASFFHVPPFMTTLRTAGP